MSGPSLRILFTAFEPSGDLLAGRLLSALRERHPDVEAYALGGPKLEDAGAELLEETTGHAQMGLGAVTEVRELRRRVKLVKHWLRDHPIDVLVPVDSPAANWHFCKAVRKGKPRAGAKLSTDPDISGASGGGAKIVHLVAPQVWAWATWRVNWLKRLSDHLLCLLPFEPDFFATHGIPATFVGHPLFEPETLVKRPVPEALQALPGDASPRLALLPGSRPGEVAKNWADMLGAFEQLRFRHPKLAVAVAAADEARARQIERQCPGGRLPRRVARVVGDASAVLDWADCAVVVSGTATLEAVSRGCPHVALFRYNRVLWNTLGRLVIRTRTFTLPNLLAEHLDLPNAAKTEHGQGRVVPELVPHAGGSGPILDAIQPLLQDASQRETQRDDFRQISEAFAGVCFTKVAVDTLLRVLRS